MDGERLNSISLHQEMQRSYLEYAMSVIVGRALPDARDGLKPVQRRILFAMHELGLTPDRPFKKCARVVGDVLGKYHPHGDQAVYDALVRLVQDFTCKYPVLSGHGNFGSIDDDPPAAMRYTETRLAEISNDAILKEIDSDTVNFSRNFDGSQQEPEVLPAQLPFLILNGCTGIAVGMATSIPPHNLNEVVSGLIELIKNPDLADDKLFKIIQGPDFPTGGEVLVTSGIKDTYLKGKGSIAMRGIAHIEEVNPGKGKHKRTGIVITELPYQVSKSGWIEKLAEQVNDGKVNGIADIRDESDRSGMRILIEVRRDSNPEKILKELYRKTNLQCNYGATLLALVNNQPKQLSLKQLLLHFIEFREFTIVRRTRNSLNKINNRLEIIEALTIALNNLRDVINLIEKAKDALEARNQLINKYNLNISQGDGILAMPLRRLTSLEKNSLKGEQNDLKIKKFELEKILNDRNNLLSLMSEEFKILKKKFGIKRKSQLIKDGDALLAETNTKSKENQESKRKRALESIPKDSFIRINWNNQLRISNKKSISKINIKDTFLNGKDFSLPKLIYKIDQNTNIICVTKDGKTCQIKWEFALENPNYINKFLPNNLLHSDLMNILPVYKKDGLSIGLLTSDGKFKRISLNEVNDPSGRSSSILKLKENIIIKSALICENEFLLTIVTTFGRILKIKIDEIDLPLMGKLAQGSVLINLFPSEKIVNAFTTKRECNDDLILLTKNGDLCKVNLQKIKLSSKGNLGVIPISSKKQIKDNFQICFALLSTSSIIYQTNNDRYGQLGSNELINYSYNIINKNILGLNEKEYLKEAISIINII